MSCNHIWSLKWKMWKLVQGFRGNNPRGGVFFSASLRFVRTILSPPIPQISKSAGVNTFKCGKYQHFQKKPQGVGFLFLLGSLRIGAKKPHPLGLFPRTPCTPYCFRTCCIIRISSNYITITSKFRINQVTNTKLKSSCWKPIGNLNHTETVFHSQVFY